MNRLVKKGTLDTVTSVLFGTGTAGISMAVYNSNVTAGVFGAIALVLGIALLIYRTKWNEDSREEQE